MWFRRDGCLNTLHKWYLALLLGVFLVLTLYSSISCNFPLAIRKKLGHKTDTETCSEVAYNFITYLASANCLLLKCLLLCNSKHLQKERVFSGAGWWEVCWLSGQSQPRAHFFVHAQTHSATSVNCWVNGRDAQKKREYWNSRQRVATASNTRKGRTVPQGRVPP